MTAQEQQMLDDLTGRINGTALTDKDPEAEQYLRETLGRNPDALYILAQTVLVQQYGLDQAKQQLEALRNQPPPPQKHTSFLGNLLGSHDDTPPPQQYPGNPQAYPPPSQFPPQYGQPQYGQPQYGAPQYGQPPQQQQQGGFLRSAMQTATGVAAGALAFEGIESLFHGFGGGGGGNRGNFGDFGGGGGREEVINNYYGDSPRDGQSRDIEDRRDDRQNFAGSDSRDDNSSDSDQSFDSGDNDFATDDSGGDFSSDDNNS